MLLKIVIQDICYFIRKKPLIFFLYIVALIAGGFTVIYISAILDRSYTDELMVKTPYIVIFSEPQSSNLVYDILKKNQIDIQKDSSVYIFNEDACEYNMLYIQVTARKEDFQTIEKKYRTSPRSPRQQTTRSSSSSVPRRRSWSYSSPTRARGSSPPTSPREPAPMCCPPSPSSAPAPTNS